MLFSLLFAYFSITPAHAGKLADGFRGVPYGPASVIAESPLPSCVSDAAVGVQWQCDTTIGDAQVKVSYMADEGLFYGIFIKAQGYVNSDAMLSVLQEVYGKGFRKHDWDNSRLADRMWKDSSVFASFEYNKFSNEARFVAFDNNVKKLIDTMKSERAKQAVDDL